MGNSPSLVENLDACVREADIGVKVRVLSFTATASASLLNSKEGLKVLNARPSLFQFRRVYREYQNDR